jgi:hypothetical protein
MDKREKLEWKEFVSMLQDHWLDAKQVDKIVSYLSMTTISELEEKFPEIKKNLWYINLATIFAQLTILW